jgi:hypothetical protein
MCQFSSASVFSTYVGNVDRVIQVGVKVGSEFIPGPHWELELTKLPPAFRLVYRACGIHRPAAGWQPMYSTNPDLK